MEEKIERILRSAGIESSPVDPSSMEALRKLVIDSSSDSDNGTSTSNCSDSNSGRRLAAKRQVNVHAPVESPTADAWTTASAKAMGITSGSGSVHAQAPVQVPTSSGVPSTNTNILLVHGSSTGTGTSLDAQTHNQSHNQILKLLHMHTILMMETQRKLDAMAAKVDALERKIKIGENNSLSGRSAPAGTGATSDAFANPRRTSFFRQQWHAAPHESSDNDDNNNDNTSSTNAHRGMRQPTSLNLHEGEGQNINVDIRMQTHADIDMARPNEQLGLFQSIIETISKFYLVRIGVLFWSRSRGFVRPIDGALMFKLVFMLLVMTAKISRSNTSMTSKSVTKITISILIMLVGFLYHTKYLQFCYHFFWKENIPMRVWAGEDVEAVFEGTESRNGVDNAHMQVPRFRNPDMLQFPGRHNHVPVDAQAPDVNGNINVNHFDNLRQIFIGGAIHPPNQGQNPIVALLQDTLYLLGSFFLSIFPMWQPLRPLPRHPPDDQLQEQQQDPPEIENAANNNNNPGTNMHERGHHPFHSIPVVAPPPDVMTPTDDDNDDGSTAASLE